MVLVERTYIYDRSLRWATIIGLDEISALQTPAKPAETRLDHGIYHYTAMAAEATAAQFHPVQRYGIQFNSQAELLEFEENVQRYKRCLLLRMSP